MNNSFGVQSNIGYNPNQFGTYNWNNNNYNWYKYHILTYLLIFKSKTLKIFSFSSRSKSS